MPKQYTTHINAIGISIQVRYGGTQGDYFSLTDMAGYRQADHASFVIQNWMRNRMTVRFLGLWEQLHNPNFNYLEFEVIERSAGVNSFVLTPKQWVERTNARGHQ